MSLDQPFRFPSARRSFRIGISSVSGLFWAIERDHLADVHAVSGKHLFQMLQKGTNQEARILYRVGKEREDGNC